MAQKVSATTKLSILVSRTGTTFGDRAFSSAGPRVWNNLTTDLKTAGLVVQPFKALAEDVYIWSVGPKRSITLVR